MSWFPNWHPVIVNVPLAVTLDAYTANDVVGGKLWSNEIQQFNGGGYIAWIRLMDGSGQAEPYYLYCYTSTPATLADSAAFAPITTYWLKQFTCISIPAANYDTTGVDSVAFAVGKDRFTAEYHIFPPLDNNLMYFYLVCLETPDYAATTDLRLDICYMVM